MANRKNIIPTVFKGISIPKPLADRVDLELWSVLEGRVPQGAYQAFYVQLLVDYFSRKDTQK